MIKPEIKKAYHYIDILSDNYQFDKVVSEQQKQWWKEVAKQYLSDLIRCYSYL